jgi:hypothetical protein
LLQFEGGLVPSRAYEWAYEPTADAGTPDTRYKFNAFGEEITITRSETYDLRFMRSERAYRLADSSHTTDDSTRRFQGGPDPSSRAQTPRVLDGSDQID